MIAVSIGRNADRAQERRPQLKQSECYTSTVFVARNILLGLQGSQYFTSEQRGGEFPTKKEAQGPRFRSPRMVQDQDNHGACLH